MNFLLGDMGSDYCGRIDLPFLWSLYMEEVSDQM